MAGTKILDKCGDKMDAVTVFLIENDMNGVEVKESENTLGCNGIQQCEVTFNGVELGQGKHAIQPEYVQYFNCPNIYRLLDEIYFRFTLFRC